MKSLSYATLVVAMVVGIGGQVARADSFGFSFSSGQRYHHGHHHHHHHCAPGWGISYGVFAPPPPQVVYVEPAPVIRERVYVPTPIVQERVIVPTPAPTYSAPVASSTRLPPPPNREAVDRPVVVRNASTQNLPVAFLVDSRDEDLQAGQSRTFSGNGPRVIEFDRGGDRGVARYELTGGLYTFVVTGNGWDLVRDSETAQTAKQTLPRKNELPGGNVVR